MKKILLLSFSIFLLGGALVVSGCTKTATQNYDAFAQCLTDKGVKMYGAYWCSHCKDQKEMFGDSFKKVTYVECAIQGSSAVAQECKNAGVESYPTWIFSDNSRLVGTVSLENLASKSGCVLDGTNTNVSNENTNQPANINSEVQNTNASSGNINAQ